MRPDGLRVTQAAALKLRAFAAMSWLLVACDAGAPGRPSAGGPPVPLTVTVVVVNTRFGNAIDSDFSLMARMYKDSARLRGGRTILVPASDPYDIDIVAGPDGYSTARSATCSGSTGVRASPAPCVITETELPLGCDDTFWAPTYSRDRLVVLSSCEGASGIVRQVTKEHDGDLVLHIAPDPPYRTLLRGGNADLQNQLVVEIPCQGPIDQRNAVGTCDHYQGPIIQPPPVGAHIAAAAHHVQDRNHGMWAELHGATVRVLPH